MLRHSTRLSLRGTRSTGAFTLVELLVVIGIIALLIAILLPALNKARESAKMAACASNMRQTSMSMLNYANMYKGWLPPASLKRTGKDPFGNTANWQDSWAGHLLDSRFLVSPQPESAGYMARLRAVQVLRCPSRGDETTRWHYNPGGLLLGVPNLITGGATNNPPQPLSRLRPAHRVILLAESFDGSGNGAPFFWEPQGGNSTRNLGWQVVHSEKRSNFAFTDGHVASYEYTSRPINRNPDPTKNNEYWCFAVDWEPEVATLIWKRQQLGQ